MKIYLDLLPQERKQGIRRKKRSRKIISEEILFLFPIVVFIVILSNIYYLVKFQRESAIKLYAQEQAKDQYQELDIYEKKFKDTNDLSVALLKIQENHLHWSNLFEQLSEVTSSDIAIGEISTKNYQIFLLGKAKTRESLLNFKAGLEKNECFSNINVPLSNLVTKEDIDFQMDMSISENCLKNNNESGSENSN